MRSTCAMWLAQKQKDQVPNFALLCDAQGISASRSRAAMGDFKVYCLKREPKKTFWSPACLKCAEDQLRRHNREQHTKQSAKCVKARRAQQAGSLVPTLFPSGVVVQL